MMLMRLSLLLLLLSVTWVSLYYYPPRKWSAQRRLKDEDQDLPFLEKVFEKTLDRFVIDPQTNTDDKARSVGNNGNPASASPLQNCQSDCDTDEDCDQGLYCYQRDRASDPIPGCKILKGDGLEEDFCVAIPIPLTIVRTTHPSPSPSESLASPSMAPSTTQPTVAPTASPSVTPTTLAPKTDQPSTTSPSSTSPALIPATLLPTTNAPSPYPTYYPTTATSTSPTYFRVRTTLDPTADASSTELPSTSPSWMPVPKTFAPSNAPETSPPSGVPFTSNPSTSPSSSVMKDTPIPTTTVMPYDTSSPTTSTPSQRPSTDSILPDAKYVGNDGSPSEAFPLQACQGDCDSDSDCSTGLVCHLRQDENGPVPGCQNRAHGGPAGTDFCVSPYLPAMVTPSTSPSSLVVETPDPTMVMTYDTSSPTTLAPSQRPTTDPILPDANYVGNDGSPREAYPLQACQGDCDSDSDCVNGLVCYLRQDEDDPIPGCWNRAHGGPAGTDFCVSPTPPGLPTIVTTSHPSSSPSSLVIDTPAPTMVMQYDTSSPTTLAPSQGPTKESILPYAEYVGNDGSPREAYPLQACQGDCDSDSDCDTGLLCYERQNEKDPIPGCRKTGDHGGPDGTDFCVSPASNKDSDLPVATIVGNDNIDESLYPLKMCQGDCDEDWDCEFPLICYQRDRSSDPIPGCSFDRGLVKESDFCVPSQADDGSLNILEGAFRLRLYWEEGYVWQESTVESFWCASTHYNKDPCWYGRIGKRCRSDHMYLTRCGGTSVKPEQQAFVFVPFDDEQVLIQSANRQDLRCWERSGREILLRTCDADNPLQRWIATDGTSFFDPSDNRFEISQIGYEKQCVSNDHHPKEAEAVELHSCVFNRDPESQTAYWERF